MRAHSFARFMFMAFFAAASLLGCINDYPGWGVYLIFIIIFLGWEEGSSK